MSQNHLSMAETGLANIGMKKLFKLADILNIDIRELMAPAILSKPSVEWAFAPIERQGIVREAEEAMEHLHKVIVGLTARDEKETATA